MTSSALLHDPLVDFDIICQNFYIASVLRDLFHNIHPRRIILYMPLASLINFKLVPAWYSH